jgi:hypothetical protein
VPGYRDDAQAAACKATGANARPAGTPQCRAVSCVSVEGCRSLGVWRLNRAPAAHRVAAAPPGLFVEHVVGEQMGSVGLKEGAGRRPDLGPKPS